MTTHKQTICRQCGTPYSFQGSGHWEGDYPAELNDDRYCPDCMKVILEALSKIEKRFEWRDIPTTDYTVEELLEIHKQQREEAAARQELMVRRVFIPLYDFQDMGNIYTTDEVKTPKGTYRVSYWTKKVVDNTPNVVKKHIYWDIKNSCQSAIQP